MKYIIPAIIVLFVWFVYHFSQHPWDRDNIPYVTTQLHTVECSSKEWIDSGYRMEYNYLLKMYQREYYEEEKISYSCSGYFDFKNQTFYINKSDLTHPWFNGKKIKIKLEDSPQVTYNLY